MKIGITGISTTGKSTIANALQKEFGGKIYNIDDFYGPEDTFPLVDLNGKVAQNWDSPVSLNWEEYKKAIFSATEPICFIDSFLLCYDKDILNSLNAVIVLNYNIDKSQEEAEKCFQIALERRVRRLYNTDVPENYQNNINRSEADFECNYYEKIVWPMALNNRDYYIPPDSFNHPVLTLDATNPLEGNISQSIDFIRNLLK